MIWLLLLPFKILGELVVLYHHYSLRIYNYDNTNNTLFTAHRSIYKLDNHLKYV